MTTTASTVFTTPKADFTTSGGAVNTAIFLQELVDAPLSLDPTDVVESGSNVLVTLPGVGTAQDLIDVAALAAAHEGNNFSSPYQSAEENLEVAIADDTDTDTVELLSGPLPQGDYDVEWYCEHDTDDASAGSKVILWVDKNGAGYSQRAADAASQQDFDSFSGKMPFNNINDGDTLNVKLTTRRTTVGTGNANSKRHRVYLTRSQRS